MAIPTRPTGRLRGSNDLKILSSLCVSLGILLIVAAFVYPLTVKTESLWTREQAQERIERGIEAHASTCAHSHNHAHNPPQAKHEDQSLRRYERIQAELNKARERPHKIASILKWLGVVSTVLGAGVYYATSGRG